MLQMGTRRLCHVAADRNVRAPNGQKFGLARTLALTA